MSRDENIVKIDRKEDYLSRITMLNVKDVQKILQVSQAKGISFRYEEYVDRRDLISGNISEMISDEYITK